MEAFRQFLKGWLGKLLLFIFLAPLAFLGIESYFSSRANSDILVTVGEKQITQQEFNRYFISAREQQLKAVNGDASQIDEVALKNQILDSLIDRSVLLQKAKELGLYPNEAQINAILLNDPEFQENGKFSQAKFEAVLRNNRIDKRHVFANMSEQMALREVQKVAAASAFMTKPEQDKLFDLQSAERNIWVKRVDSSDFTDKVTVSKEQINAYYNKHKSEFKTKRTVDLSYIKLNKNSLTVDEPNATDIDLAYKEYVKRLKNSGGSEKRKVSHLLLTDDATKANADNIIKEIKSGMAFADAVKKYSQDESTKTSGGQLDYFKKTDESQDKAFIDAIFTLKQAGDISEAVETQYGIHIIHLDEIKSDIPTKESMLVELTNNLKMQKYDDAYHDLIKKINDVVSDGVSLQDVAQDNNLELKTAKDFKDEIINTAVLQGDADLNNPDLKKQIFDEFNIADQIASIGVSVSDDTTVWVQSKNYRAVKEKTLEQSSQEIKAILLSKQAKELAKKAADAAVLKVNNATDSNTLVKDDESFEEIGVINRQNQILSPQESAGAFSIKLPEATEKVIAKSVSTDSGYSVMAVSAVTKDEAKEIPQMIKTQMTVVMSQLAQQKSYTDYLEHIKSEINIEKNKKLIQEVIEGKVDAEHR